MLHPEILRKLRKQSYFMSNGVSPFFMKVFEMFQFLKNPSLFDKFSSINDWLNIKDFIS